MITKYLKYLDLPLLGIILCLALISCFSIASADPLITANSYAYEYLFKQVLWYGISFLFVFFIYYIESERIYQMIWYLYIIVTILLFALALQQKLIDFKIIAVNQSFIPFAKNINGATCWYVINGIGSFQPSEFMKIILIILLSNIIHKHNLNIIHSFVADLILIIKVSVVTLIPCLFIYLQNDAGVTIIILASMIFMLFGANIDKKWFIIMFLLVFIIIFVMIYLYLNHPNIFFLFIKEYRLHRFYGWLAPEKNYHQYGYQLFNALLSYGSAGLFGHGFQSVRMPFPEPQTDFIFAVILQSIGLIGGIIVILLIIGLDIRVLQIGAKARQKKHYYLSFGIFGLLIFQQAWNISMILGLLPITGITLPFISYGGSSLLSYMLVIGMLLDIEKHNKEYYDKIAKYTKR